MYPFHNQGGYMPGMYGAYPQRFDVNLNNRGERKMSSDEKVTINNINPSDGGHRGGDGVGGLGAMAAIAALGNRNDSRSNMGGFGGDGGFGFGGGGLGALLAVALLGRGGLGGFGGDRGGDGCCEGISQQIVLGKLGSIEAAVPLSALQVQNAIQEQTIGLNSGLANLALGLSTSTASVKDSVQASTGLLAAQLAGTKDAIQNGLFLTNTNLLEGICSVKAAVDADGDKTRALLVSRFQLEDQTRITTLANENAELRNEGRFREQNAKIEINNTAIAAQQQGQLQAQQQQQTEAVINLGRVVGALVGDIQAVRQGQVIFNSGTMAASGTQAAANTRVA